MNLISAMSSLLNIAALRSLTEGLLACQLGSNVVCGFGLHKLKFVLVMPGLDNGELFADAGWVICVLSLCEILCGGD